MSNLGIPTSVSSYSVPTTENSETSMMRKPGATGASRKPFNDIVVNSKSQLKADEPLKLKADKLPQPKTPFEVNELPKLKNSLKMSEMVNSKVPAKVEELLGPKTTPKASELPKPRDAPSSSLRRKMAIVDREMSLEQFMYACEEEPVYDLVWDKSTLLGAEDLLSVLDNYYKYRSCSPTPLEVPETLSPAQTPEPIKFDLPCFPENLIDTPEPIEFSLDDIHLSDPENLDTSL